MQKWTVSDTENKFAGYRVTQFHGHSSANDKVHSQSSFGDDSANTIDR